MSFSRCSAWRSMPAEPDKLAALVAEIGRFHVTDRNLRRAQERIVKALAQGEPPPGVVEAYLISVKRYFAGFEREARAHLQDLERRLGHASQVQFNLTAELGVAARRVEAVQGVLAKLAEVAER